MNMPTESSNPKKNLARFYYFPCLVAQKMQENKDPAIRLFGKKISLPSDGDNPTVSGDDFSVNDSEKEKCGRVRGAEDEEEEEETEKDPHAANPNTEEPTDLETLPGANVNPKTPSIEEEKANANTAEIEKEQSDTTNSQDKTLKKPDKILPCPRCNSMDTKFCYYNNYNVHQPRHFCKACQRYWTAGGTMRNVPVGAGRRKNKNSASHYRQISISDALQVARIDASNGTHYPTLKSNGRVLSFGLDVPICDSMASVLSLTDKKVLNGARNGFHSFEEQRNPVPGKGRENGDDCSSGSSITVSNSMEGGKHCPPEPFAQSINGYPPQIPCLPGVPWPYPWNSAVPPPALCPPGFPMPFYPTAYWNCGVPGTWNVPWLSPQSSPNQKPPSSGPHSPTLGKHPRDVDMLKPDNLEREEPPKQKNGCILVPKTLRIDDPSEAAKSSIWATLGIKNESICGGGMFKAFQSKGDEKHRIAETSAVLLANPAALSRSLNFHESS